MKAERQARYLIANGASALAGVPVIKVEEQRFPLCLTPSRRSSPCWRRTRDQGCMPRSAQHLSTRCLPKRRRVETDLALSADATHCLNTRKSCAVDATVTCARAALFNVGLGVDALKAHANSRRRARSKGCWAEVVATVATAVRQLARADLASPVHARPHLALYVAVHRATRQQTTLACTRVCRWSSSQSRRPLQSTRASLPSPRHTRWRPAARSLSVRQPDDLWRCARTVSQYAPSPPHVPEAVGKPWASLQ